MIKKSIDKQRNSSKMNLMCGYEKLKSEAENKHNYNYVPMWLKI